MKARCGQRGVAEREHYRHDVQCHAELQCVLQADDSQVSLYALRSLSTVASVELPERQVMVAVRIHEAR